LLIIVTFIATGRLGAQYPYKGSLHRHGENDK
jgi:hypothetical protein